MSRLSTVPILFAAQCVFLTSAARTAAIRLRGQSRARSAAVAIALALCIWGLVSSVLAIVGVYDGARFLSSLPGFWLPAVPILLVGILVFVLPFIRSGVHDIART